MFNISFCLSLWNNSQIKTFYITESLDQLTDTKQFYLHFFLKSLGEHIPHIHVFHGLMLNKCADLHRFAHCRKHHFGRFWKTIMHSAPFFKYYCCNISYNHDSNKKDLREKNKQIFTNYYIRFCIDSTMNCNSSAFGKKYSNNRA